MSAMNPLSRLEATSFPVDFDVQLPISDGLERPDFSQILKLPVSQLPQDKAAAKQVILGALTRNRKLLDRLVKSLHRPFIFGVGANGLVMGGSELGPRSSADPGTNFYGEALSNAVDRRADHLASFRYLFANAEFPASKEPIWIPGSDVELPIPAEERENVGQTSVRVANLLSLEGWEDRARFDTPAGTIPAIVVQFVFDRG